MGGTGGWRTTEVLQEGATIGVARRARQPFSEAAGAWGRLVNFLSCGMGLFADVPRVLGASRVADPRGWWPGYFWRSAIPAKFPFDIR
jgi:hypothetical protein